MNVNPTYRFPTADCLTEDQVDDQLIGDLAPVAAAHLAVCDHCRARVAAAEQPLTSFREVSLAWAERQSATMPTRPGVQERPSHRLAWASVATAVLAIGVAIPVLRQHGSAPATMTPALAAAGYTGIGSVTPVAATSEQIESDNRMLEAIERELDAPADGPAEYGLLPAAARSNARARTVRD